MQVKMSQDLEDLISKDDSFNVINTNYDSVVKIIKELYLYYLNNKDDLNLTKKFNTKMMGLMRYNNLVVKKSVLLYAYNRISTQKQIKIDDGFLRLLQKKPCRNISGIVSITVLTSPKPGNQKFSCKHNCYYCPNEPGQPRSYLSKEPAVQRANRNNFDAIDQMLDRLNTLAMNGHEIDKLEIIIEGGTFTEYPEEYLETFIRDMIYVANTYYDDIKRVKLDIEKEIEINENSKIRIIGICCETRPDCIVLEKEKWLKNFRKWGITRVQIGVQHIDDYILKKINRGHKLEDSIKAIKILKDNCFKVDIHIMPDLPGSSLESDKNMMWYLYNSNNLQPDQMKIYPCEVVPWTVIEKWYNEGTYQPYATKQPKEFVNLIKEFILNCPPWIRLPRVVRDIPLNYISGGNKTTNLRQLVEDMIKRDKKMCMEMRYRECGRHKVYSRENAELVVRDYQGSKGHDYFISFESPNRVALFGFLRLRFPKNSKDIVFDELKNTALIRELHVYGSMLPVGVKKKNIPQHTGLGKMMLQKAEEIALEMNYKKIAVISGIGVTKYYKKFGYKQEDNYMIKNLCYQDDELVRYLSIVMLFILFFPIISQVIVMN